MKKNYNVPAIEVVAFASSMVMLTTSPAAPTYDPNVTPIPPGSGNEG